MANWNSITTTDDTSNYDYNINGNWNDVIENDNSIYINTTPYKGTLTFSSIGVEKNKYDALKKIALDLIRGGFGCSIDQAKELLKLEMKGELFPKEEPKKIKDWIDPELFKI